MNWIKTLHKGGDGKNVTTFRTIMIGSLIEKLFGCIMGSIVSAWTEKNGMRVYGQDGFSKYHNTMEKWFGRWDATRFMMH